MLGRARLAISNNSVRFHKPSVKVQTAPPNRGIHQSGSSQTLAKSSAGSSSKLASPPHQALSTAGPKPLVKATRAQSPQDASSQPTQVGTSSYDSLNPPQVQAPQPIIRTRLVAVPPPTSKLPNKRPQAEESSYPAKKTRHANEPSPPAKPKLSTSPTPAAPTKIVHRHMDQDWTISHQGASGSKSSSSLFIPKRRTAAR